MNGAAHLLNAEVLARHGARTALICGADAVSYAELARRVQRAAGALGALGVQPGDRVLLLMRDTPELAVAWLGCLWHGAVAVALNSQLSEDDYRYMRSDSGARLAVVDDALAAAYPRFFDALVREQRVAIAGRTIDGVPAWRETLERAAPEASPFAAELLSPAFWLYSSGTTGRPKGIIHTHKDVLPAGQVLRETVTLAPGDKVLVTSRIFFAYGLENALLGPLSIGATSVLNPDWANIERVCALVAEHRPAAFFSVPSFYRRLLSLSDEALAVFRPVRHFFAAGERLPEAISSRWHALLGREILSIYGMSETFCVAMVTPPGTANEKRTGQPLAGVEVRLVSLEGHEATAGEPGVLWIRHPALAFGYANRAEQTREQFRDGWFCTKDVFVRDAQGFFQHQGRSDELIKVAGQWVKPNELEEAVLGEAGITEAACVPVPDADGFERLALFVAASADPDGATAAAARACEDKLPRHKRPKWVRAVTELPRTATGKVQRFRLREILERELTGKR